MPRARHPDKVIATLWMHRALLEVVDAAARERGVNRTQFVLDALAEHLGVTLDEAGAPLAESLERLAVQAFENRKRTLGKRSPGRSASEVPPKGEAGGPSGTGEPNGKNAE